MDKRLEAYTTSGCAEDGTELITFFQVKPGDTLPPGAAYTGAEFDGPVRITKPRTIMQGERTTCLPPPNKAKNIILSP